MIIQSKLLNQFDEIVHGFSTVSFGNMSLAKGTEEEVLKSRSNFCAALGVDYSSIIMLDQVHGTSIISVTSVDSGKGAQTLTSPLGKGDGLCTREKGVPITVLVADCAAIFCYDPENRVIGLAHSGWRGTASGIVTDLLSIMEADFGSDCTSIYAWVSPCIGDGVFEVEDYVLDIFRDEQPELTGDNSWYKPGVSDTKWFLDIKTIIQRQFVAYGVKEKHLDVSPDCTYTNNVYYSYRRDGKKCGHMMALFYLKKDQGSGVFA